MSPGEWIGNNIFENNNILILGESHYGDENNSNDRIGEIVPYKTKEVVKEYLDYRNNGGQYNSWYRFFDNIVASFGYQQKDSIIFWNKVFFGNYVPVLCGRLNDNKARYFISEHKTEYNNQLFNFINENKISKVVCFSRLVYDSLPSGTYGEKTNEFLIGMLGEKRKTNNYVKTFEYIAKVKHENCEVMLDKPLKVFGFKHPSSPGGYSASQAYQFIQKNEILKDICK